MIVIREDSGLEGGDRFGKFHQPSDKEGFRSFDPIG
jgi:hypothetical protein